MTAETPFATLPVLDDAEVDHNDYAAFEEDLIEWCCDWTWGIVGPVAKEAKALFEVPAVRILARKYADAKRKERKYRMNSLHACASGMDIEIGESAYRDSMHAYSEALWALLVK